MGGTGDERQSEKEIKKRFKRECEGWKRGGDKYIKMKAGRK